MFNSLSNDYMVNVSDVINLEQAYFVSRLTNIEAAINTVSSTFYMIIVFFHTPKSMKNFKKLMLLYIVNIHIVNLGAICLRFTLLMPFKIAFPLGILGPLNVWQSFIAIYFTVFGAMNIFDILVIIFLERHFILVNIIASDQMRFRRIIYVLLISSNLTVLHVTMVIGILILPPEGEAVGILQKHVMNSEILLNIQNSLLMLPNIGWVIWMVVVIGCTYVLVRLLLVLYVLYYNYRFGQEFKHSLSRKTRNGMMIIIKVLVLQMVVIGCIAMIPIAIGVFCFIFLLEVPQTLLLTCGCIMGLYPTVDVCCSLIVIQPYRLAVIRFFISGSILPAISANRSLIGRPKVGRRSTLNASA